LFATHIVNVPNRRPDHFLCQWEVDALDESFFFCPVVLGLRGLKLLSRLEVISLFVGAVVPDVYFSGLFLSFRFFLFPLEPLYPFAFYLVHL
jgi:hypothetical protein